MKKHICAAIVYLAVAATAFATPDWLPDFRLSTGAGGILGGHFTRYSMHAGGALDANQDINQFDFGAFAFFDATFATFSVNVQHGQNRFEEPVHISEEYIAALSRYGQGRITVLGLSLLLRWPFNLNDTFTVFPLLGMDYNITLRYLRTNANGVWYSRDDGFHEYDHNGAFRLSDWNAFIIRLGAGAELDITDRFFIRGDLLFGIRLMTNWERRNLSLMQNAANDPSPDLGGLSFGPSLRVGVGMRL